jgi:hypothetical protein
VVPAGGEDRTPATDEWAKFEERPQVPRTALARTGRPDLADNDERINDGSRASRHYDDDRDFDDRDWPMRRDRSILERAESSVAIVAILIIIAASLGTVLGLFFLAFFAVMCFVEPPRQDDIIFAAICMIVPSIMTVYCLFMLYSAYRMRKMESYALALTAAVMTVLIPNMLTIGLGIWALVVLTNYDVKQAFRIKAEAGLDDEGN